MGAALLAGGVVTAGCAGPAGSRAVFPKAMVNGHPVIAMLDTGAGTALMAQSAAKYLGVKYTPVSPRFTLHWFDNSPGLAISDPVEFAPGLDNLTVPLPVADFADSDFDVLVGWPEVQDNILVFNPNSHYIRAVPELPPETADWVKLKIHPKSANGLQLEVPLPDGRYGLLSVDTGTRSGVILPTAAWQAWKGAHPQAPADTQVYGVPYVVSGKVRGNTWADEVSVGPVQLTDVPVRVADWNVDRDYVGTLGMLAFDRLEFVLDGKGGYAYFHARLPVTDAINTNDWTVGPSVRLNSRALLAFDLMNRGNVLEDAGDHAGAVAEYARGLELDPTNTNLRLSHGNAQRTNGDYPGAIADFDSVLALDPQNRDALDGRAETKAAAGDNAGAIVDYGLMLDLDPKDVGALLHRGEAEEHAGDHAGATADFERARQLDPQNANVYYQIGFSRINQGDYAGAITPYDQAIALAPKAPDLYQVRGLAYQNLGDSDRALADFDQAVKLNPDFSFYPQFFRELVEMRRGQTSTDFAKNVGGWKAGWAKSIGQFILGQIDETALLAAAEIRDKESVAGQRCEAYYYLGAMRLLHQDTAGAREFFQKCVATGVMGFGEYQLAKAELARMDAAGK